MLVVFHFICIFEGYRFVAKCLSRADLAMFFSLRLWLVYLSFCFRCFRFLLEIYSASMRFFCFCFCFCFFVFNFFSHVGQADVRLVELEREVRALEQEKTLETTEGTLVNLRRYLNRPNSAFDRFEVLDILQALVRLARTQAHQKAEEYAAALDEVRARWDSLSSPELQRLLLGLLGDPVRAKVAKEVACVQTSPISFVARRKGTSA